MLDRRRFIKLNTVTAAGLPFVKFLNPADVLVATDALASGFTTPPEPTAITVMLPY